MGEPKRKPRTWYGWRSRNADGFWYVQVARKGLSRESLWRRRLRGETCVKITELPKPRKSK